MFNSDDIVYSYTREEDISGVSLTSHGTKDSFETHCSSTTMLHTDGYWIIETESNKTKYVLDTFCMPSFDVIHFASSFSKKGVDTRKFPDLFEEIDQRIDEWGLHIPPQTGLCTYKYRMFHIENCYGDSVFCEYPLISVEIYVGSDIIHHISYGGPFSFSEFKERIFSLLSEECAFLSMLDVDSVSVADFNVDSIAFSGYSLGTLLHEAVGHLLEFDHAQSLGLKVGTGLTQGVNICESPKDSSFGFCPCSDEGIEPGETVLLADGIIKNFIGSFSVGGAPYCHGRAQQCTNLPLPRNTSLKMKKGTEKEEALFQGQCVLYVHKKIKPVLCKVENGIPFYDVEIPRAYIVKNEVVIGEVSDIRMNFGFRHFFDEALITSKIKGNQVGYCVKSQQRVESTQFAPGVVIPVENIQIYQE